MAPPNKPFVGVDLGGTNMQIGVVSPDYKILAPAKRKTKSVEGLDAVLTRIVSGIEEACHTAGIAVSNLGGVGIGAPGAVDPDSGVVIEAVNLRWKDTPVAELLSKRLKCRVYLDNDVNVAVYGEWKLGAGRGCDDVLGVWIGTGIGGGLILNGKLYYGHFKTAGEIGHTILFPNNPRGHRSLEHNCSRTAVVDQLVRLIRANNKSKLAEEVTEDAEKIKSRTLARHYRGGDREDDLVIEVIDRAADDIAYSVANTVTLLSLPRVVLGGGLTEACGKPFVERVQKATRELVFPPTLRKVEVLPSQLEDNAGVFGAAMIAMDRSARDRRA